MGKINFEIDENGCFVVDSQKPDKTGYVKVSINGKREGVHRHIYRECFGNLQDNETVRHSCGNYKCVNPEHLFKGEGGEAFTKLNKSRAKKIEFKVDNNDCFIITSHVGNETGHTKFVKNGKRVHIHRHIYEECFGEIPKGMVIRHTCDNGRCINPEHLIIGTQRDNIQDMMDRDRNAFYKNSKLNIEKVKEIKMRLKNGEKPKDIFADYGVSKQTIEYIQKGKTWKHVEV
jgi:hypothetical protein